MVDDNSIQTYEELNNSGYLGKKQEIVYSFIKKNPYCSDLEIKTGTGLNINCVTGRRKELQEMGLIRREHNKVSDTNRTVATYIIGKEIKPSGSALSDIELKHIFDKFEKANYYQLKLVEEELDAQIASKQGITTISPFVCKKCRRHCFEYEHHKDGVCKRCAHLLE